MPKVFIGIGHGGTDSGAVAKGFKEKDLNLAIGLACRDYLVKNGITVQISRVSDTTDYLADKIHRCNVFAPDLAIDIHNNSGGGNGAECLCGINDTKSKEFAQNVLDEIGKLGQEKRGVKTKLNSTGHDYFGFIREVDSPSIIVECAFIDTTDVYKISTPENQKKMGEAIARGIMQTLGIKPSEEIELDREELEQFITNLIDGKFEKVYHFWKELPEWAFAPIKALYDAGYFTGAGPSDLNLSQTKMECLVIMARAFKKHGIITY